MNDKAQNSSRRDWTRLYLYLELGCLQELENVLSGNLPRNFFNDLNSEALVPAQVSAEASGQVISP